MVLPDGDTIRVRKKIVVKKLVLCEKQGLPLLTHAAGITSVWSASKFEAVSMVHTLNHVAQHS